MSDPGAWRSLGNHKLRVEGDIVFSVWDGPSTLAEVQALHAIYERVIAERGRVYSLIDLRKAQTPPPEARRWINDWSERYQLAAVACFGASFTVRTFATLIVRAIRVVRGPVGGKMEFFETEAQARAFLASQRRRQGAIEAHQIV